MASPPLPWPPTSGHCQNGSQRDSVHKLSHAMSFLSLNSSKTSQFRKMSNLFISLPDSLPPTAMTASPSTLPHTRSAPAWHRAGNWQMFAEWTVNEVLQNLLLTIRLNLTSIILRPTDRSPWIVTILIGHFERDSSWFIRPLSWSLEKQQWANRYCICLLYMVWIWNVSQRPVCWRFGPPGSSVQRWRLGACLDHEGSDTLWWKCNIQSKGQILEADREKWQVMFKNQSGFQLISQPCT